MSKRVQRPLSGTRGPRVEDLTRLVYLADVHRAVVGDGAPVRRPVPARVALNWQAGFVHQLLMDGLWRYMPPEKGTAR